jgi:hypothetical protein
MRLDKNRSIPIVFSPSFPYRLSHNLTAFYITTAFVVLSVGAWLLRRARATDEARMMIRMALDLLIILVPLQMFLGDQHGLNTLEHQPAKLAAIEGRYDTAQPTPLPLFGIPDDAVATMRYAIEIPDLGSLILTHSWNGVIKGLKGWPADQRPPVGPPFFAFRIMVGIAFLMLFIVVVGQILRLRGRLWDTVWFLRPCQWVAPFHSRCCRLDDNRGRPPTLDCVWTVAHRGFCIALAHGRGRGFVACLLCRRLFDHVPDGHCIHGWTYAPRPTRAGGQAGNSRRRLAKPPLRKCGACGLWLVIGRARWYLIWYQYGPPFSPSQSFITWYSTVSISASEFFTGSYGPRQTAGSL